MIDREPALVIFDCDGVLVDSEPISCRVMAEALREVGLPSSTEDCMREYMGRSWSDSLRMIERRLGEPLPEGFSEGFRARRDSALAAEVTAVDGIAEALERIEQDLCVASSGSPEKIRLTLGTTGLLARFEGRIYSAEQVERGKPHPDLFLHAAGELGYEPGECAVVEDTVVGVEAARGAGMLALGYSALVPAELLARAGARPFASMAELPGLLEASGRGRAVTNL